MVHARKAISRIYTTKANLMSVENQMKAQAAQVKVAGSLKQSADVMRAMQQLIKVPEMQKTMMEMSKEMMKVRMQFDETKFKHIFLFFAPYLFLIFLLEDIFTSKVIKKRSFDSYYKHG